MPGRHCPPQRPFCPRSGPAFLFRPPAMDQARPQPPEAEEQPLLRAPAPPPGPRALQVLAWILSALLPITGIVLGSLYIDQCPRQPLVPIYLLVLGAVALLLLLLGCFSCREAPEWQRALLHHLRVTCLLFLCAWFIAGSVWVYSIFPPDYEAVAEGPPRGGFCQRTLFLFTFGITTALHAALAVALLFSLCLLGAVFLFGAVLPHGGHGDRGGP